MAKQDDNTLLYLGIAAAVLLFLRSRQAAPVVPVVTAAGIMQTVNKLEDTTPQHYPIDPLPPVMVRGGAGGNMTPYQLEGGPPIYNPPVYRLPGPTNYPDPIDEKANIY